MMVLAVALPGITFLFARWWSVPLYLSNDDVSMEMLLRGAGSTNRATALVLFIHSGLGQLLVWLYAQLPGVSWYWVVMNGALIAAGTTISWAAVGRGLTPDRLILIAIYCLGFLLSFFVRPNFTISAAIATQAAMILWLGEMGAGRALRGPRLWAFVALVLMGGMIRIDACMLQVAIALPMALWLGRKSFQFSVFSFQWVRAVILPVVIAGGIVGLLRVSQSYVYATTPGWEHFEEFNYLRAQFTDFEASPFDEDTRAIYERAGWSKNDYQILMSWLFENPGLYSIEKFKAILSVLPYRPSSFEHQLYALGQRALGGQSLQLMVVGALGVVFFVGRRGGWTGIGIACVTVASALVLVLAFLRRMPPQVYGPALAFIPGVAVILPGPGRLRRPWRGLRMTIQALCLTLLVCWLVNTLDEWSRASAMVMAARRNFLNALDDMKPGSDRVYVSWGTAFPYELILGDEDFATVRRLNLVAVGCLMQTPVQKERLHELGIRDLYRSMFEDPRVFVLCDRPHAILFERYVKEHYDKLVKGRLLVEKPLGEYRVFNTTESRYEQFPRVLRVQKFEEPPN